MHTLLLQPQYRGLRHQLMKQKGDKQDEQGRQVHETPLPPRSQKGILFREIWLVGNQKLNNLIEDIQQGHWTLADEKQLSIHKEHRYYALRFTSLTHLMNHMQQRADLGLEEAPYAIVAD